MTVRIHRILSVMLCVVLLCCAIGTVPVSAQTSVAAALSVDQNEYTAGSSGLLNISLSGMTSNTPIAAMDFYIEYNPDVVSFEKGSSNIVTSAVGVIVPSSDDITVSQVDDGILKVLFFGSNMSTIDSIKQNGVMLTLPFTVSSSAPNGSYNFSAAFAPSRGNYSEGQSCTAEGVSVDIAFENKSLTVYTPSFTNPYKFTQVGNTSYENKGYISGFTVGDSVSNVKADFGVKSGATITVKNSSGNTVADGSPIGTGMVITIDDGIKSVSFTAVVFGDVDGDGIINAVDSSNIDAYLVSITNPTGPFALAHDLDKNGNTDAMDSATMDAYLVSLLEIEQ